MQAPGSSIAWPSRRLAGAAIPKFAAAGLPTTTLLLSAYCA